ncbi:MAG: hypothetical protein LBR39_07010 [Coriobacteriales bacterium]|jgi:multidrug efflux pump subunit AcrA (membrane-fusion protein)|nr:hypothetical protein [Coriobacteriales bacterium]
MVENSAELQAQLEQAELAAERDREKVARAEARVQRAQDEYSAARQKALDANEAQKAAATRLAQLKKDGASSEELQQAQAELNKARKLEKAARKTLTDIHEQTKQEIRKADKVKDQIKQRLIISDGYVVDQFGNRLRRYGRFERFVDNKKLAYGTLILAIVIMLVITVLFTLSANRLPGN